MFNQEKCIYCGNKYSSKEFIAIGIIQLIIGIVIGSFL